MIRIRMIVVITVDAAATIILVIVMAEFWKGLGGFRSSGLNCLGLRA